LNSIDSVRGLLKTALQLGNRADQLTADSPLMGAIAEFDSMAVVTLITLMEEQYDIRVEDDEISADTFATVGTLAKFIEDKLGK
jgi:acyl carrier protein